MPLIIFAITIVFISTFLFFLFLILFQNMIYTINNKDFDKDITFIKKNGQKLFSCNTGGKIGLINFTLGMLPVDFYDLGIIINPFLFGAGCILKDEIISIENWKGLFINGIKIYHNSKRIKSAIILYVAPDNKILKKLLSN